MAAAPQQGGQPDNSMAIIWIVLGIFVLLGIIWIAFKKALVSAYFKLKLFEISVISLFTHQLNNVRTVILSANPDKIVFNDVVLIGEAVGNYMRFPFIAIILVLAFVVYVTNSTRIFKRIYTMRDLVREEKENWPQIVPIASLDLVKTDINKGPWAMALTPMQFCKRHKLLEEHKRQYQEGMSRKEWGKIEVTLKRGQANKIFAVQLGPVWQGINRLPPHIKALFAAFAARCNQDSKAAETLLRQISASSAKKLDFRGVDELCKKYENTKMVQHITSSHAYILTVMASMLVGARTDGVQATADFLWLKPVDRRLWYMLSSTGRQTPFVEVAGPFSHWLAEREIGRKLMVPMVEEATNALEIALKEIVYKPDEKE